MIGKIVVIRKSEKTPDGFYRLDVTSHDQKGKWFSPFKLGPVTLDDGSVSRNMENAWQFSKVYADHVDGNGNPTDSWWQWRSNGFADERAHRHPHVGKPLYSYYCGQKLGYIDARKAIYIPLYVRAILGSPEGFNAILYEINRGTNVAIADFDGYNFKKLGMSYEEVVNNPNKIMGHGHVLAMMVERPDLINLICKANVLNNSVLV